MTSRSFLRRARRVATLALVCSTGALASALSPAAHAAPPTGHPLAGHVPPIVAQSQAVARADAGQTLRLAVALPLRNQAELTALLNRLYDPADPQYGQFLTSAQFAERFGPTQADYDAVATYYSKQGLQIVGRHANRAVLDVQANTARIENVFRTTLNTYAAPDGTLFRAPASDPRVPASLSGKIAAIVGLDDTEVWHPHNVFKGVVSPAPDFAGQVLGLTGLLHPNVTGSGPGGGLTPSDIKTAYNLSTTTLDGSGQALALFELDGYTASDITAYEGQFGLPATPLQNVLVDGYSGAAGSGAGEVTLDIELQIALAPRASKIYVYEGPNSSAGVVDTYNRIASDNLAKSVSTSWGLAENSNSAATRNSENTAFQQMAAQGQSIFAASGDSGAYDNGSSLSVDDPASQPYMTGVGGTSLTTNGAGGSYKTEKTWASGTSGGGGGISTVWPIPSYQSGIITAASKGSTSQRNVPDVSLDADPNNGYAIYYNGAWNLYGGTSCAAPLWSAFTALVNQQRVASGKGLLGFANPSLYTIGKGATYASDFHDIADGSTNRYYPAVSGYDLATGLGTINGVGLLTDLAGSASTGGGGGGTASQLLGNPGFENGSSNPAPWSASSGVIDSSTGEPAHGGSWKAWLDGYGSTHTDTLQQSVAIPSTVSSATLTFWLHIDTAETTTTTAYDTLKVQVRSSSGTVLATLATYSNLNKNSGYAQKSFNLSAYKGQTVQIYLVGAEDGSLQTSFVVDDFALNVQ